MSSSRNRVAFTGAQRAIILVGIMASCAALGWAAGEQEAWRDPAVTIKLGTDIQTFGVSRNGQDDVTKPLQKMIDSGIGSIVLPRGTYRITEPLVIDLDKVGFTSITGDGTPRIVMAGPGPAIKFIGTHEGTAAPTTVKDNVWRKQTHAAGRRNRDRWCS